jgi:hypothetical protein
MARNSLPVIRAELFMAFARSPSGGREEIRGKWGRKQLKQHR